ncbi:MAG: hypothetical protein MUF38_12860 [Anaerolineae bacterium]|jgi:hypothetical protein|nr:hypothetical protein [Anaerolineae bacterium]
MNAIDKVVRYFLMMLLWGAGFIVGGIPHVLGYTMSVVFGGVLLVGAALLSHQLTWRPQGNVDKLARYGFLATLWFVTFLFSLFASRPMGGIFILWFVELAAALFTSITMFPRYGSSPEISQRDSQAQLTSTKRKNDQSRPPVDPLDVLTNDDLAELRQEIKDEIRARLRYGSNDELTSLEDLMDDRQPLVSAKRKS